MMPIVLMGLGAGLASATLFASIASGSFAAIFLFYLAPLPILIAALGWSHWAGFIAAIGAALGLALVFGFYFGAAFMIGVGVPGWWLGYLALLGRPSGNGSGHTLEWYPAGRLVLWAAVLGTLVVAAAAPSFGLDRDSFQAGLRGAFEQIIRAPSDIPAPNERDFSRVLDALVIAIPPAAAVLGTTTNLINLWLAARLVKISGRLHRPWPDLATLRLPRSAGMLLIAALVGWAVLPGILSVLASAFSAGLLMAFAVVGFSVMHAITRGMPSRAFVLAGLYAAVVVFGWPIAALSVLGITDIAFDLRGRLARRRGPPNLRNQ